MFQAGVCKGRLSRCQVCSIYHLSELLGSTLKVAELERSFSSGTSGARACVHRAALFSLSVAASKQSMPLSRPACRSRSRSRPKRRSRDRTWPHRQTSDFAALVPLAEAGAKELPGHSTNLIRPSAGLEECSVACPDLAVSKMRRAPASPGLNLANSDGGAGIRCEVKASKTLLLYTG